VALKERWQRYYFRGRLPNSDERVAQHQTRLRMKPVRTGQALSTDSGCPHDRDGGRK
jgi:hypothetical protein